MKKYAKVKVKKLAFGGFSDEDKGQVAVGALSGAATGASMGSVAGPWGTAIGAGVGALYGGVTTYNREKKENSLATEQELAEQEALRLEAQQKAEFELNQQKNYTTAYNAINPVSGREGVGIYAKGGNMLQPLATNITKAVGNTHEEGGILIGSKGKPIAEVEDQEVINGTKVYSNQLTFDEGTTYAKKAEQLAKKKGKFEEKLASTSKRERDTAERMTSHIDNDLNVLFMTQEAEKKPVNGSMTYARYGGKLPKMDAGGDYWDERQKIINENTSVTNQYVPNKGTLTEDEIIDEEGGSIIPSTHKSVNWASLAQKAVPYIDNIYNASIVNKTPNIPTPTKKLAYNQTAMPMKTTVNVDPELNDANRSYQLLTKDINENTSNSPTARGNKLAGFSTLLNNRNRVYGAKNRIETDLVNANSQNIQQVNNANIINKQNIDNANLGQTDAFNYAKMQRTSDINAMKTANVAQGINDATKQIQDSNMSDLDRERIMTDMLRYPDGSGVAQSIGSTTMDSIINKDREAYNKFEKILKDSEQFGALDKFYARYGRK